MVGGDGGVGCAVRGVYEVVRAVLYAIWVALLPFSGVSSQISHAFTSLKHLANCRSKDVVNDMITSDHLHHT